MSKYILIFGNPVDGMSFEGPFEEFDDAEDHTLFHDNDWWIAELKVPEEKISPNPQVYEPCPHGWTGSHCDKNHAK